ncbi:peptidoglycan-binding protein [Streptomyces vastus]|uniref:Peptidoglycan-binding protein n=1 Tax=Streptomyces vastus TaxID=285451 RepID=A0ABN3QLY4_9ACTN
MHTNVVTRSLVSVTVVVGIAAGSLAGAGAGFAASGPAAKPAVSSEAAVPLAVDNLGRSTAQAQDVQRWPARYWGYTGAIDGLLGTNSSKAFQRNLQNWGYTGPIDGIAGSGTQAAFTAFADGIWP